MSLHSSHPVLCACPTVQLGKRLTCHLHLSNATRSKQLAPSLPLAF